MDNQTNSKADDSEQTVLNILSEQQTSADNSKSNAVITFSEHLKTQPLEAPGTEIAANTDKQPKHANQHQDIPTANGKTQTLENASTQTAQSEKPLVPEKTDKQHSKKVQLEKATVAAHTV